MEPARRTSRPPRERLATLRDPRGTRNPRRPTRSAPKASCPECGGTRTIEYEGMQVCESCGVALNESNIVAEVTFGESAAGAAVVQGGFVGEGSRHARTMGPAFRRAGGGMESREVTENFGRDEIRRQANNLHLSDNIADQAFSIYKLAANGNFIQGRRINVVASICLYVACRRDKNNQTLLMDFSEAISVNVFKLGQTYQDLKKALVLPDNNPLGIKPVVDVENLILKFARKLEFGNSLYKVAEDAARIIKRMKRDWMVTGRRPAGLCGACIILAARMNNFRRTVREVVYVVKVADMTVAKRLEEFKNTASGDLTVDQFREYGVRLKHQHDPPAVYQRKERERKKRSFAQMQDGENQEGAVDSINIESEQPELRRDADGFAIPNIPVDPMLIDDASNASDPSTPVVTASPKTKGQQKAKPKKPKKTKEPKKPRNVVPEITEADLVIEDELEDEMEEILNDPNSIATMEEAAFNESQSRAKELAEQLRNPTAAAIPAVSNDPEIGEEEFEDDPEVRNCLLSEFESKIKEKIWVTHNEDWLRGQQAKILKKALDDANGTGAKPKKTRKKGRMGDGSLLEGGTPVEDAAEATQRMLEKRANRFSKHINYEKLNSFYAGLRGSSSGKGTTDATTNTESEPAVDIDSDEAVTGGQEDNIRASVESSLTPQATPERTAESPSLSTVPEKEGAPADSSNTDAHQKKDAETKVVEEIDEELGEENWDEEEDEEEPEEDIPGVLDEFGIDAGNYEDEDEAAGFDEEDGEEY